MGLRVEALSHNQNYGLLRRLHLVITDGELVNQSFQTDTNPPHGLAGGACLPHRTAALMLRACQKMVETVTLRRWKFYLATQPQPGAAFPKRPRCALLPRPARPSLRLSWELLVCLRTIAVSWPSYWLKFPFVSAANGRVPAFGAVITPRAIWFS